ncbi:hypothetical protein EMEDMD4_1020007 [Sinorhizobium medicae]|uniref:HMA domain-containing protein n=1 Tax=Sinorhizobium medicae TaxID=110321 RepID=A0A508WPQ1_9HYPH|nr:hypothetical protein EMEDMD4_1020007 [Sinorhizobium medicae]
MRQSLPRLFSSRHTHQGVHSQNCRAHPWPSHRWNPHIRSSERKLSMYHFNVEDMTCGHCVATVEKFV